MYLKKTLNLVLSTPSLNAVQRFGWDANMAVIITCLIFQKGNPVLDMVWVFRESFFLFCREET